MTPNLARPEETEADASPSPQAPAAGMSPSPALRIPAILLEGDDAAAKPPPASTPVSSLTPRLPQAYGTKQIWLVARDPHSLYAHWDLTPAQQQEERARARNHELLVRLYLQGGKGAPEGEVIVPMEKYHCFLQANQSGAAYRAELGFYSREGTWQEIAASSTATTPAEGP